MRPAVGARRTPLARSERDRCWLLLSRELASCAYRYSKRRVPSRRVRRWVGRGRVASDNPITRDCGWQLAGLAPNGWARVARALLLYPRTSSLPWCFIHLGPHERKVPGSHRTHAPLCMHRTARSPFLSLSLLLCLPALHLHLSAASRTPRSRSTPPRITLQVSFALWLGLVVGLERRSSHFIRLCDSTLSTCADLISHLPTATSPPPSPTSLARIGPHVTRCQQRNLVSPRLWPFRKREMGRGSIAEAASVLRLRHAPLGGDSPRRVPLASPPGPFGVRGFSQLGAC